MSASERTARAGAGPCGFTLLELMVTVGVIAVLLGVGVGYLGRSSGVPEATSALAGQLRAAALLARSRGLPTEVLVQQGVDGARATVRARGLEPVAVFGFEPDQPFASDDIKPAFGGERVDQGRFGHAQRPKADAPAPLLSLPLSPRVADLRDGLAVRLDLLLDRREAAFVLRLGKGLEVTLDDLLRPRVRIVGRQPGGRAGTAVDLESPLPLPVGRWCTLEVGADGSSVWCALDGRALAREGFHDEVLQQAADLFEVGSADAPLPGAVDEVQLFAYALATPADLPLDVEPAPPVRIAFDGNGEPVEPPPITLRFLAEDQTVAFTVGPGGVLR